MPYIAHTPEFLLPRSDSKNPATTCRGITSSGRPCRRSIGSPTTSPRAAQGVVAVVSDNDKDNGAAAFFCWQHKDQAEQLAKKAGASRTNPVPVENRTSIDTLLNRIGVLHIGDAEGDNDSGNRKKGKSGREESGYAAHTRQARRPLNWDDVRSSVPSVTEKHARLTSPSGRPVEALPRRRSPKTKRPSFFAALCCLGNHDDDDYVEVVRHKRRTHAASRSEISSARVDNYAPAPVAPTELNSSSMSAQHTSSRTRGYPQPPASVRPTAQPSRPDQSQNDPYSASETFNLLSLLPTNIAPSTAASVLAELSKPVSPHDEEGYIYIYWLTPSSASGPPSPGAASSLLAPSPHRPSASNGRRTSDVLQAYAGNPSESASERERDESQPGLANKPILLKIGRASNVHRRMNEWTRQCSYDLTLLRWYPHTPSFPPASPATTPSSHSASSRPGPVRTPSSPSHLQSSNTMVRKVPHVHRVERLIHLELADKRVRRSCGACGKEHREWFEVEGTRKGIKAVDEVVRRWVGWSERMNVT